jgi:hypothetical protein
MASQPVLCGATVTECDRTTAHEKIASSDYVQYARGEMSTTPPKYPQWQGNEPCRSTDPEAFYPDNFDVGAMKRKLRRICDGCPSFDPCQEWAIWNEDVGFWGGLSANERQQIRKTRNIILRNAV